MGRFDKLDGDELILTGYFGFNGLDSESAVREVKEQCGWDLKVSPDVARLDDPTDEEIGLLRIYDPERLFLGKAAKKAEAPVGAAS
jgi:hypothetical protein